jgi:hypothetical protein
VPPWRRLTVGEQRPVLAGGEVSQVIGNLVDDELGHGGNPLAPRRLGLGADLRVRRELILHAHCAPQKVDVLDVQGDQLADAQARAGSYLTCSLASALALISS